MSTNNYQGTHPRPAPKPPKTADRESNDAAPKPEPATPPVLEGKIVRKPKSLGKRFVGFFGGVDVKGVVDHIVFDIVVPTIEQTVVEVVRDVVEQTIGRYSGSQRRYTQGEQTPQRQPIYRSTFPRPINGHTPYNRMSSRDDRRYGETDRYPPNSRYGGRPSGRGYVADDIIFDHYGDASNFLGYMRAKLDEWGTLTIRDMYEAAQMNTDYTDEGGGWDNLDNARVVQRNGNYMLDLPTPIEIRH